eukprot:CAMPEP_0114607478 /NCGR_PEP_ID=MMETSP0168-20121206/2089_1 /TAXON_ID=95228 ORGANISM="Vannella sp., Strain DIVA3 517/6/12" /NCGR_SAMPLE_ID=MMETSP0168 /ASSEMBLY_ACC=CAM_ASM_000044 /LENGTH=393 /DNA_ID=CAMNT_0001818357 /DNA_START=17 /DNA_END=1195 /DNA_ORIENTATION=-
MIQEEVARQLRSAYDKFIAAHPSFLADGGRVHVVGHSLGSVICYDLLCKQEDRHDSGSEEANPLHASGHHPITAPAGLRSTVPEHRQLVQSLKEFLPTVDERHIEAVMLDNDCDLGTTLRLCMKDEVSCYANVKLAAELLRKSGERRRALASSAGAAPTQSAKSRQQQEEEAGPQLGFCVHNLFMIGSPLGMFVTVRGYDAGETNRLPACRNIFNLYHPNDPVAYRLEPWIDDSLADLEPVTLPAFKSLQKVLKRDTRRASAAALALKTHGGSELHSSPSRDGGDDEADADLIPDTEKCNQVLGLGSARIDYTFPSTYSSTLTTYASVAGAHSSYWKSKTMMMFIVKTLYSQLRHPACKGHGDLALSLASSAGNVAAALLEEVSPADSAELSE